VPDKLPTHRQEIFAFLTNFRDSCESAQERHEHSQNSTSAESHRAAGSGPTGSQKPLLPAEEENYLRLYGRELFEDMIQNEYKSQFTGLLTNQVKITR